MFKQLGSLAMGLGTWEALYTCPAGKTTIISKILFKNLSSYTTDFLLLAGAGVSAIYYVSGASGTPAQGTEEITGGIILNAGESLYVYSSQATGFSTAWGDEMLASSTLKQLGAVAITQNAWTNIYQCPAGKTTFVSKIIANNAYYTAGQTAEATMYLAHFPAGQSWSTKWYVISQQKVLKNGGRVEVQGGIVLNAGDLLMAFSNQTGGNCVAWGDEQSVGTAKMLGAMNITAYEWNNLYTVPSGKQTVASKIILINNNTSFDATMYLDNIPAGQGDAHQFRIVNGETLLKNGGQREVTGGITMASGDVLYIYSTVADCTAIAWGDEINA